MLDVSDKNLSSTRASFKIINELPKDLIQIQKTVRFVHRNIYSEINARIIDFDGNQIKIKLNECVLDTDFISGDIFSLIFSNNGEIYKLDCTLKKHVFADIFFDTFEISASIDFVSFRKELRSHKRYATGLLGEIKSTQKRIVKSVKVKDISQKGFGIISNASFETGEELDFAVALKKQEKLHCGVKVITKTTFGNLFLYGLGITEITKNNYSVIGEFVKNIDEHCLIEIV